MHDDTLIYDGGDVKALGSGKVGGYLVRFGGPESADVQGDYFTPETDFGRAVKAGTDVIYHHGLSRRGDAYAARLGNRVIGDGTLRVEPDGLVIEAALDLDDPDVKALYADVEAGRMGWSSGSTDRLVKRTAVKGKARIDRWPIIEGSLSPRPVDPRNRAYALKSLMDEGAIKGEHLGDYAGPSAAMSAISSLGDHARMRIMEHMRDEKKSRPEKLAACKGCLDEYRAKSLKLIGAMMEDGGDAVMKAILDTPAAGLSLLDAAETLVADVEAIVPLFAKAHDQRAAEGRHLSPTKREAIKATRDALDALHAATAPRPDPTQLARLRAKLALAGF